MGPESATPERPTAPAHSEAKRPIAESVRELEALPIDTAQKVDLVLVLAGEKPAHAFSALTAVYKDGKLVDQRDRSGFDNVAAWGSASGLVTTVNELHLNSPSRISRAASIARTDAPGVTTDRLQLLAARDEVWLAKLEQADATDDDELLGECYGFPPTAREAFVAGRAVSPQSFDVPDEVKAFAQFGFSPEHWQQEMETARRWGEAVRRLSPALFAETVNASHPPDRNSSKNQ